MIIDSVEVDNKKQQAVAEDNNTAVKDMPVAGVHRLVAEAVVDKQSRLVPHRLKPGAYIPCSSEEEYKWVRFGL
jgi:hypothetical protein